MSSLSVSIPEWIGARVWQIRELVAGEWGDDAAGRVSSALNSYVTQEADSARMRQEITELRARLRQYEPETPTPVDPGPTWTGD